MPHKILTIAGSDTLAGGGLQADLATFSNYNFFGLSVTTSIVTVTPDDFQIFPL
ncbi:bifunctional hydroxymethylpyrimidine kinase/phosphomethylpyrimidine kinase, partial [Leuconostoc lactis]